MLCSMPRPLKCLPYCSTAYTGRCTSPTTSKLTRAPTHLLILFSIIRIGFQAWREVTKADEMSTTCCELPCSLRTSATFFTPCGISKVVDWMHSCMSHELFISERARCLLINHAALRAIVPKDQHTYHEIHEGGVFVGRR